MYKTLLLTCLLLSISSHSHAGKLYKIVDENGMVTFSQYPPAEKSESSVIEDVKMNTAAQATLSKIGNTLYCGDMRLPNQPVSETQQARFIQDLVRRQKEWNEKLERVEQQIEKNNYQQFKQGQKTSYYNNHQKAQRSLEYQKRKDKNIQTTKELRCAISWGKSKQHEIDNYKEDNHQEVERLQQVSKNLKRAIKVHCGKEPLLDPSKPANKHARSEWMECSQEYRRDLRKVDGKLRQADSNYQRIN